MLRIIPATGERLLPALKLLYSEWPADARASRIDEIQREIEEGEFDPQHLLLAELNTQPVGVQLTILRDDDVGMVWPPVVDESLLLKQILPSPLRGEGSGVRGNRGPASFAPHPQPLSPEGRREKDSNTDRLAPAAGSLTREVIEDELLTEAARRLDTAGAWIGQALLEPNQTREQAAMQRNGFRRLTELRFFERPLTSGVTWPPRSKPSLLTFEPYHRSRNRVAFVNVLEASYRGSLDCPELNGVRDGQQSLKNHEAAGSFNTDMWRLYRRAGEDVGVLLMAERLDQQAWEVLYLGVVESARRCGIGRAMLLDALAAARKANAERLLIVADARNVPAVSLYESLGFQSVATRIAFVHLAKSLPSHRPHDSARQQ